MPVTVIAPPLPLLASGIHHSKSLISCVINDHELLAVLIRLIIGIVERVGFRDCGLRRELRTTVTAVRVVRIHLVDGDEVY
jgi:hypothetical protein